MRVRDVIQEFIPCEVCGNSDISNFYFHVFVHQGSQPYVKCCECKEEYYSTKAREIITRAEDARRRKSQSGTAAQGRKYGEHEGKEYRHPLLRILSQI
ncbi:MAG: hypothetical protein OIN66_02290 [Candidatus Methanoperedens sp.]|nr:hypothetical protein [Candidatus Methanoperedens sp.]